MEKRWVPLEMKLAAEKAKQDTSFRLIVVKLDDEPLDAFWSKFLYLPWDNANQQNSALQLLSSLTGKNPVIQIAAAAVLSKAPSETFVNSSNTVAEHSRNHVLYYMAHVKQLLSAVYQVGHDQELRDTIGKLLQLSLFEQLPSLQGGIIPIEPAVFEIIYANRMRIPPKIMIEGLPSRYSWDVLKNSEISCRLAIYDAGTKNLVQHPVPLAISLTLDARF